MAKRQKTTRFSIQSYDLAHYRTTEAYAQAVQALYDKATTAVSRAAARGKIDPDKPFSFDMYPSVQKEMQRITEQLASNMQTVIETGSRKQWLFACQKNDGFLASIMDTSKLSKGQLKKMQDQNLDALAAFQGRKVDGMNLSQRVWKYVGQYKDQLENALDVGLGEGRSADELSRDVRQNLRDPNRLFRRVRDKRGNLVLSKNARAYHPGQGVYRSSYKNAMRLTRSEINMAYRESDYQRWQQLDFVVGFEIHRSNHEPLCKCDICSKLVGRYPKTFKFKGWHPQCMCYATPILMDEETFDANELGDLKAALHGTEYKHLQAKNVVSEMPKKFTEWVEQHIEAQKGWSSTPYFIRDNFVDGRLGKGLKIAMPTIEPSGKVDFHVPFEQLPVDERIKFNNEMTNRVNDDCDLIDACRLYGIDAAWYDQMTDEISIQHQYWRVPELNAARDRLKAQLMAKIEETRMMAQKILSEYEAAAKSAEEWVGDTTSIVRYARDTFNDEASEQYPNYKSILKSANGGALDVSKLRASVDKAKADYNKAIADAKACVSKYDGNVDVSSLKALINENRTTSRNAKVITTDIQNEIKNVQQRYDDAQKGFCSTNIDECQANKIEHREVKKHQKEVSMDDIISRIGGGDRTRGSCASLGLAYAANRGGYDVLDFRDGESRAYFASHPHLSSFIGKMGGITNKGRGKMSGIELMRTTEIGKEYYLAIACHAAIVRQVSKGKYEYLELQSATSNGWKPLNAKVFGWRFRANGREWHYEMIEISKLYNDPSFIKLMGYINTAEDKQVKGKYGTIK